MEQVKSKEFIEKKKSAAKIILKYWRIFKKTNKIFKSK